jgi:hypothetical protein
MSKLTEAEREEIEGLVCAYFGAGTMLVSMSDGMITDGVIAQRDELTKKLTNKIETLLEKKEKNVVELTKLLEIARCSNEDCDQNGTIPVPTEDGWVAEQCQFCDERLKIINKLNNK